MLEMEKLKVKRARSVKARKAWEDLKLHKLRIKRLAEELPIAEAWELELEVMMCRAEESLKPPVLGLLGKLEEVLVSDQQGLTASAF